MRVPPDHHRAELRHVAVIVASPSKQKESACSSGCQWQAEALRASRGLVASRDT